MNTDTAKVDPYLRIEQVTKTFGAFVALNDVSLDISSGEFVCFLGPSGCGKTTLLRVIAGLDTQTSGRIFQAGRDISNQPPSRRDFGIVFQSYALFPNLTIAANVSYGLVNRRRSKAEIEQRVDELLRLVGLPASGRKYPAQLSGGEQQRVAVARALAISPGLLLLDEPLSALDARVRAHLRREIRKLHESIGITTIMVTHDQEEALTMADRIVVMNHGVIEQVGTPIEIYRKPRSQYVADFIGITNFLPGEVTGSCQVRCGGIDFACEAPVDTIAGPNVTLTIRPEDVVVRNVAHDAPNSLVSEVSEIEFLGAFCRVTFALNGGDLTLLADVSINALRDLRIERGQQMRIAFPQDRLRVFPQALQTP